MDSESALEAEDSVAVGVGSLAADKRGGSGVFVEVDLLASVV